MFLRLILPFVLVLCAPSTIFSSPPPAQVPWHPRLRRPAAASETRGGSADVAAAMWIALQVVR
eukprot:3730428-Pyramimonas_sp.AAC.1